MMHLTRTYVRISEGAKHTRQIVKVNLPEKPDVEKFILIERPGIAYVNTACNGRKGVVQIVAPTPKEKPTPQPNR